MDLLSEYCSDEDDTAESQAGPELKKRKLFNPVAPPQRKPLPLPSLPSLFTGKTTAEVRNEEERKKHQGRVRTFPHVEGNYPTYVYIPVNFDADALELVETIRETVAARLGVELHSILEPTVAERPTESDKGRGGGSHHVSLSRTMPLREHTINPLIKSLSERLAPRLPTRQLITFGEFHWFTNDDRTRSFLSLNITGGKSKVCAWIAEVNEVLKQFALPVFYENPKPHVTIAWALGDLTPSLPAVNGPLASLLLDDDGRTAPQSGSDGDDGTSTAIEAARAAAAVNGSNQGPNIGARSDDQKQTHQPQSRAAVLVNAAAQGGALVDIEIDRIECKSGKWTFRLATVP